MTREIKFCGKRVDNGELVVGYLLKSASVFIAVDDGLVDGHFELHEVIPESVGQFTGIYDKNGVEVYGGDIYDIGICAKVIRTEYFIEDTYELMKLLDDGAVIEVIGSIHDNPSLLEVQP